MAHQNLSANTTQSSFPEQRQPTTQPPSTSLSQSITKPSPPTHKKPIMRPPLPGQFDGQLQLSPSYLSQSATQLPSSPDRGLQPNVPHHKPTMQPSACDSGLSTAKLSPLSQSQLDKQLAIQASVQKTKSTANVASTGTTGQVHPSKPSSCQICGKLYVHRASLFKHIRSAHPESTPSQTGAIICRESECKFRCRYLHQFWKHLSSSHGMKITTETKQFASNEGIIMVRYSACN